MKRRSVAWFGLLIFWCGCASSGRGPAGSLTPAEIGRLPVVAPSDPYSFVARKDGTAVRGVFKGAAELAVTVTELHIRPNQSVELAPKASSVYEVREGRAALTTAGQTSDVAPGGFFTLVQGAAATITNVQSAPLDLHVMAVRSVTP